MVELFHLLANCETNAASIFGAIFNKKFNNFLVGMFFCILKQRFIIPAKYGYITIGTSLAKQFYNFRISSPYRITKRG